MFLAPFFAEVFFPTLDPLTGIMMTYGIKSVGMISRPLGATVFGHLVAKYSVKTILAVTLGGVAVCTFCIGIIPDYNKIGLFAPLLLVIFRALQGFFAAGEHNIAALFIMEQVRKSEDHLKASSYYLCSTMSGTIFASLAATIVSLSSNPAFYWRFAFIIGLTTAITGLIIRVIIQYDEPIKNKTLNRDKKYFIEIATNKYKLFKLIIFSSFGWITYSVPFIFFNNFVPLISSIKTSDLLIHNTALTVIDLILIPICAFVIQKFNITKCMAIIAGLLTITIIPIFYLLPHLSLMEITLAKLWILVLGVAFSTPLNVLKFKILYQDSSRYLLAGFSHALGGELLGRNVTVICLALWYKFENLFAPSAYLAFICLITTLILIHELRHSSKSTMLGNKNMGVDE